MTSVNQNFTLYAGDSVEVNIGIEISGVAASLSGASIVWVLEEYVGSGSLVRLTTDDYISVSGSVMTLSLSASHSLSLAGKYYHEAEVTDTNGNISTTTTGIVTIKKSGAKL